VPAAHLRLDETVLLSCGSMANTPQQPFVTTESILVEKMGRMGYFGSSSYRAWQPQPLDRPFQEEGWASAPIELLTKACVVRFEYTRDPNDHPKDVPDLWRLVLLPAGAVVLEKAGSSSTVASLTGDDRSPNSRESRGATHPRSCRGAPWSERRRRGAVPNPRKQNQGAPRGTLVNVRLGFGVHVTRRAFTWSPARVTWASKVADVARASVSRPGVSELHAA
jgi:hypothetical protein